MIAADERYVNLFDTLDVRRVKQDWTLTGIV